MGLSCGGSIEVLIERFAATPAWEALRAALEQGRAASLVVGVEPAALAGRTLAVLDDGSVIGSLDPELDARLAAEATRALAADGGRCVTLPWRGAEATVFVEGFPPPRRLFVAGATQIAAALAKLARPLGHRRGGHGPAQSVRNRRADARRPRGVARMARRRARSAPVSTPAARSSCSAMIRSSTCPTLALALRSPAYYVGALGSRRTHARRLAQLREVGLSETRSRAHPRADRSRSRRPRTGRDRARHPRRDPGRPVRTRRPVASRGRAGRSTADPSGADSRARSCSPRVAPRAWAAPRRSRRSAGVRSCSTSSTPPRHRASTRSCSCWVRKPTRSAVRSCCHRKFRPAWSSSPAMRPPRARRCVRGCAPSMRARRARRSCSATSRA